MLKYLSHRIASQNEKAKNIQCQTCKQTFLQTTKAPAYVVPCDVLHHEILDPDICWLYSLLEHATNKHKKGLAECFPGISA